MRSAALNPIAPKCTEELASSCRVWSNSCAQRFHQMSGLTRGRVPRGRFLHKHTDRVTLEDFEDFKKLSSSVCGAFKAVSGFLGDGGSGS